MGRGDRKSKKGKIFKGSFGNSRPHIHHRGKRPAPATPAHQPAPNR